MRIAISTLVTPPHKSGIGNYVVNLIRSLQEVDDHNEYYIFLGADTEHLFPLTESNFHGVRLPFRHDPRWLMRPAYFMWQNSLVYFYLHKLNIDLLHLPNLLPLISRIVPSVVTIPDLAELHVSKYSWLRQHYRRLLPRLIAARADRIITISDSSRIEIARFTGCPCDRIDVTYLSANVGCTCNMESRSSVGSKYGIASPYILHVGGALPHKNVERIIAAFDSLKQEGIPHCLVLAGNKGLEHLKSDKRVAQLIQQGQLILTGYVPDGDLALLYQEASLFVFPSLYEGFGIPVLEAMSCGVPVLTSSVSSLPEVAGNAAFLVNPYEVTEIIDGMRALLNDQDLRGQLVDRGFEQASRFSWRLCAQQTIESYKKASAI